jgi:hypothetical protein
MKIQIYELTKCGFYESLADDEDCQYGSLPEWWNEFSTWVVERDYKQTGTFTDAREPNTVYCTRSTGDLDGNVGVALWNVAPSWEGRALHMPPSGRVNAVEAKVSNVATGSAAGWPTYFWMMPGSLLVISLIPEGFRGSGVPHFRKYFREYLNTRSRFVSGARADGLSARFETRALRRPGQRTEIADKWQQVRKYVTNTTFEPPETPGPTWRERITNAMIPQTVGYSRNDGPRKPRTSRLEIDWKPQNRNDLLEVIEAWDDRGYDDNNWAGVKTADGRLHRFDDNLCREPVVVAEEIDRDPRWSKETLDQVWTSSKGQVIVLADQLRRQNE